VTPEPLGGRRLSALRSALVACRRALDLPAPLRQLKLPYRAFR